MLSPGLSSELPVPDLKIIKRLDGLAITKQDGEVVPYHDKQEQTDEQLGCAIHASNTFHAKDAGGGVSSATKQLSDEQAVVAHIKGRFAFTLMDGYHGSDPNTSFYFVERQVHPRLPSYVRALEAGGDPEVLTKQLIAELIEAVEAARFTGEPSCTIALGVTYKIGAKTFFAGFGIGDLIAIVRRQDGSIEHVVKPTFVNGKKDGLDYNAPLLPPDVIANRNSIFNVEIEPGDEFAASTSLSNRLLEETHLQHQYTTESSGKTVEVADKIRQLSIKPGILQLNKGQSLGEALIAADEKASKEDREHLGVGENCGDDRTIVYGTFPSQALEERHRLSANASDEMLAADISDDDAGLGIGGSVVAGASAVAPPAPEEQGSSAKQAVEGILARSSTIIDSARAKNALHIKQPSHQESDVAVTAPSRRSNPAAPPRPQPGFFRQNWGKLLLGAFGGLAAAALVLCLPHLALALALSALVAKALGVTIGVKTLVGGLVTVGVGSAATGAGGAAVVTKVVQSVQAKKASSTARKEEKSQVTAALPTRTPSSTARIEGNFMERNYMFSVPDASDSSSQPGVVPEALDSSSQPGVRGSLNGSSPKADFDDTAASKRPGSGRGSSD